MSSSEWREVKLGEVYDFKSGLSKNAKEFGFGFPFLSFKTVFNNYFIPDNLEDLVNTNEKEQEKNSIQKGDVFLTRTSETINELGLSCVALKNFPKATFNGFTKRLRPKNNIEIDPLYAGYYFRSSIFRNLLTSMGSLTTRASLNNEILSKLSIILPSLEKQKIIGNILYSLEKKLELNNRINKNLEEMAQAIFKSWFVDFEPFQDGEFVESELGRIPKGWRVGTLGDLIKRNKEKINDFDEWKDQLLIDLSNMPQFSLCINKFDKGEKMKTNIYKLKKFDILFGSIRSYFGKAGFSAIDGVVTGTIHSFLPTEENFYSYVLLLVTSKKFIDYTVAVSTGTKMPIINWNNFCNYICAYPKDGSIMKEFNDKILPCIRQISNNILQNQTLTYTRDTLLPKLMSGEIRVPIEEVQ